MHPRFSSRQNYYCFSIFWLFSSHGVKFDLIFASKADEAHKLVEDLSHISFIQEAQLSVKNASLLRLTRYCTGRY